MGQALRLWGTEESVTREAAGVARSTEELHGTQEARGALHGAVTSLRGAGGG